MTAPEVGAFVVGAGIAGLAAALELQSATREVLVIDASDRPGGMLRTDHVSGYVVERGPNTVQVKAPMLALLRRLELDNRLIPAEPESRTRYLYQDGSLQRVPLSPLALAGSRLLSGRAKLRLLAEPFLRRGDASNESVAEFMGRRLGPEVVTRLVGPFLTGLYAGNEQQLGACLPSSFLQSLRSNSTGVSLSSSTRDSPRMGSPPNARIRCCPPIATNSASS